MPLSEFYRMAGGRIESFQQKPTSTAGLSHLQDNHELVELVWENGQIAMQGQSSRTKRDNNFTNIQSHISKFGEQNLGNSSNIKAGNGLIGTILDDFTQTVPSPDFGLDRDDDMAPWLNFNDPFHNNYGSDLLPELSSVTINDHKKNIYHPTFERNQQLAPPLRSSVSNVITNSIDYAQASSSAFSNTNSGIINFSHFSRPVALARANTDNVGEKTGLVNKVNLVPIGQNLMQKVVTTRNIENPENVLCGDGMRIEVPSQQVEGEKAVEPVVASSSVCSGNNPEQGSDDQNHNLKRKSRETDDSEGRSEDVEEESVGIRKTAPSRGAKGTKRSRAAEVHNLSERRRRDRINEKMRALQELIPNCNKVDKASMLDEAIEYLKTLQLQVQIMSMGAGLYMPHMMVPAHVPGRMAHFQPMMGVGMGMGMGFGMGLDRFHGPRNMPFSGPANFQMMPGGPSLPVYGSGIPVSAPHQPSVPISEPVTSLVANDQSQHHVNLTKEVNDVLPN